MNSVIELDGLAVDLGGRRILSDLRCSLSARTVGLLGPNGAGKSTLINALLGFHKPAAGTARIFGHDVRSGIRQIRNLTGYMPENDAFITRMSAVSYVQLMAQLSGLPPEAALERAHEALFYVGLGEARYRQLGTYSLGMKLLILDEPTNGLDPPARQRMIRLIREMRDSGDLHIILCSHLLRDVEETCEEVLILKQGRIVHYANLEEERRANRKFIEMETVGANGTFTGDIEKLGCACAIAGNNRIKLILSEGVEIRDLYRIAAGRNVQIRRLNYRRDSLEDIFMKAMDSELPGKGAVNGRL